MNLHRAEGFQVLLWVDCPPVGSQEVGDRVLGDGIKGLMEILLAFGIEAEEVQAQYHVLRVGLPCTHLVGDNLQVVEILVKLVFLLDVIIVLYQAGLQRVVGRLAYDSDSARWQGEHITKEVFQTPLGRAKQ